MVLLYPYTLSKKSPYLAEIHTGIFMDETILSLGFASKNLGEEEVGGCRGRNKTGQESMSRRGQLAKGFIRLFYLL